MKSIIKKVLFTLLLLNAVCQAAQVKTVVVYFDKDKAYISNGEVQKLACLRSADYVLLKGHTDNDGSDNYNIGLSKKRVDAVKAFVQNMDKGIKIETDYFGERHPVNHNADEKEKTLNRRVEITYVSDPLMRLKVPAQTFEIDNSKEQVITCRQGTQVHIPAGAFGNKRVTINISEYYQPGEIFAANLTTHCNKAPIETAGMINITAESNGTPVESSKALEYKFPRKNKSTDFKFFEGVWDSSFNINWVLNKPAQPAPANLKPTGPVQESNSLTSEIVEPSDSDYILYKARYTANLSDKAVARFFEQLVSIDRTLYDGCLQNASADISISSDGRITGVKDNYTNQKTECDVAVQRYIWTCLPKRFSPYTSDTYIHLDFYTTGSDTTYNNAVSALYASNAAAMREAQAKYEGDNIVLTSTNLGWINCDRFLTGTKIARYTVETDPDASVRLVMKKYKSFFGTQYFVDIKGRDKAPARRFCFENIPGDEDIVLISTKKVDGQIYLAIESTKTSQATFTKFNYKAVTQDELATAMKDLKI